MQTEKLHSLLLSKGSLKVWLSYEEGNYLVSKLKGTDYLN